MRTEAERLRREQQHNRSIAGRAEGLWGWSSPAGRRRARRRAALLQAAAALQPGELALEIGCGTGIFTGLLLPSQVTLAAIDISPEFLHQASRKPALARTVHFHQASVQRLPFSSARFDAVVGSSVLHHLDLALALPEIRRVLKPGGRIAFAEPNMLNPHVWLVKNLPALGRRYGESPDETAFFRWPLRRTLQRAGFAGVHVVPFDFLHPWLPASLIAPALALSPLLERVPLVQDLAGSLLVSASKPNAP
ncbi:MAG: methyltransferase domain-containing protein [Chloroflexi bacterium]|nr:methyltransferase domain-containing protein [Chloroflexota bacterium]